VNWDLADVFPQQGVDNIQDNEDQDANHRCHYGSTIDVARENKLQVPDQLLHVVDAERS